MAGAWLAAHHAALVCWCGADFWSFVDATAELQKVQLEGLSREERMAFWINIYNILVVRSQTCPLHC